jgi:hypothetical protein
MLLIVDAERDPFPLRNDLFRSRDDSERCTRGENDRGASARGLREASS